MASVFVPAAPVITNIQPTTFFNQPAAIISGVEDLNGLPSGDSIQVLIVDKDRDEVLGSPVQVNSDGTWRVAIPSYRGDEAYANAVVIDAAGSLGATSQPSALFILP